MLPYNLVAPMMCRPPFLSSGREMTEVLGFPGGGGCRGGFSFAGADPGKTPRVPSTGMGQREAPLQREGSPAVLTPGISGFGGTITPSDHQSAGCRR